jgi:hypothetical protein
VITFYEGENLEPLPIQYRDYCVWQKKWLNEKAIEGEKFWLDKMDNFSLTKLPADTFDLNVPVLGKYENLIIKKEIYEKIEEFCNGAGVTKFIFMTSIFTILLAKEIGQQDITIGIPVVNRDHNDLKQLIGVFLNVTLIRTILNKNDTFFENLSKTRNTVLEAMENSHYPYELLYAKIREHSHFKENELFSILLNYIPTDKNEVILTNSFKISRLDVQKIAPKYDATLYVIDNNESIELGLVYKGNIFSEYRMKRILANFMNVILFVLENRNIKINDLPMTDIQNYEDIESDYEEYDENEDLIKEYQ